ncbi:MAG: cbb3-type cytochrome c oxidase subunit I, partial [Methanobacteriota archaeon]
IMTMWGGVLDLRARMLFAIGYIAMFVIGGIHGVFQAPIPVDYPLQDTYWVVAHLHYVLFGGTILGTFAGLYFWFPRMTRRMYSERLARWHFAFTMVGMNLVFFTMHFLGLLGMPRRVADYDASLWSLNWLATLGAFVVGFGQIFFIANVVRSYFYGPHAEKDPWPVVGPPGVHLPSAGVPAVAADGNGPTSR